MLFTFQTTKRLFQSAAECDATQVSKDRFTCVFIFIYPTLKLYNAEYVHAFPAYLKAVQQIHLKSLNATYRMRDWRAKRSLVVTYRDVIYNCIWPHAGMAIWYHYVRTFL